MKKKLRTIIILLVVLAVMIGAYLVVNSMAKKKEAEKLQAEQDAVIPIGEIEDAGYISLSAGGSKLDFINNGEKWIFLGDENFPVEDSYLTAIADAAIGMTAIRKIEATDELSAYGLDENCAGVNIIDSENHVFGLYIGNPIGDGSTWYASVPGEQGIYIISDELPTAITFNIYDMIELERFDSFETADVTSITVVKGEDKLVYRQEINKDESPAAEVDEETGEGITNYTSTWYDESDGESKVMKNITAPSALAKTATELKFSACKDYDADEELLDMSGLNDPTAEITIAWNGADGSEKSTTIIVGRSAGDGLYWAKLVDSKAVNYMSGELVEPFLMAMDIGETNAE